MELLSLEVPNSYHYRDIFLDFHKQPSELAGICGQGICVKAIIIFVIVNGKNKELMTDKDTAYRRYIYYNNYCQQQ